MRFSTCGARLRSSAAYVAYTAEVPQSMRLYGRNSAIYAHIRTRPTQSILCNNISYRNIQSSVRIHFGSVLNCQCRSIQTQVSIFQRSTVVALYKKGPGVCRGARPCAPLRFSHIPMWSTLCGLPQPMWHTAGSHNLCGYTTGVPQSMRHIRPKFRSPCGHSAGASAAHAVIISPYKI